jgi:hypothetical protein
MTTTDKIRIFMQENKDILNIKGISIHIDMSSGRIDRFFNATTVRTGVTYSKITFDEEKSISYFLHQMYYDIKKIGSSYIELRNFFNKYRKEISLLSFSKRAGIIHARMVAFADGVIQNNGLVYKKLDRNDFDRMGYVLDEIITSFEKYIV